MGRALSCHPTWSRFDSCACIKPFTSIRPISPPPLPFTPSTPPHQLLQPPMQYFILPFNSNATSPNSHTFPCTRPQTQRGLGPNQTSEVNLAIVWRSYNGYAEKGRNPRIGSPGGKKRPKYSEHGGTAATCQRCWMKLMVMANSNPQCNVKFVFIM